MSLPQLTDVLHLVAVARRQNQVFKLLRRVIGRAVGNSHATIRSDRRQVDVLLSKRTLQVRYGEVVKRAGWRPSRSAGRATDPETPGIVCKRCTTRRSTSSVSSGGVDVERTSEIRYQSICGSTSGGRRPRTRATLSRTSLAAFCDQLNFEARCSLELNE